MVLGIWCRPVLHVDGLPDAMQIFQGLNSRAEVSNAKEVASWDCDNIHP